MCLLWLVIIGELHIEALSQENRVLKDNIDLLAPFPKRESRWVKETGSWIHEKKKQRRILRTKEVIVRVIIQRSNTSWYPLFLFCVQ